MINHDQLLCLANGRLLNDNGLILSDPTAEKAALLRTVYKNQKLRLKADQPGIFKFSDWLPIDQILRSEGAPVTYKSKGLSEMLGLPNLYITFSGYWPQIGAHMSTGTFKECEAYSVCARKPADSGILVVASAGNTARAFIKVASENEIPMVIVVPEKNLGSLWSVNELAPCVKIIAAGGESDYTDAIRLADTICSLKGFISEGGAKNVARRDGMGTTVLSAATFIGEIPDYYFQAVGSGTGAIAAHEANLRLNESGDYRQKNMRLFVSQNIPFAPMVDAWKKGSRILDPIDEQEAVRQIDEIEAKVLSNRQPPYSLIGGLYDCLSASGGDMLAVGNRELKDAQMLFEQKEGRDICAEAGVALASLIMKTKENLLDKNAIYMLNITGGGMGALAAEYELKQAKAHLTVAKDEIGSEVSLEKINSLF